MDEQPVPRKAPKYLPILLVLVIIAVLVIYWTTPPKKKLPESELPQSSHYGGYYRHKQPEARPDDRPETSPASDRGARSDYARHEQ